jgi:hypothetical protein
MLVDTRETMTDCKSDVHMAATKADRRATQMVGWMADTQAVLTVLLKE